MDECRYWGMCRICYGFACDGTSATCDRYEPMPDVEALLELAEDCDEMRDNGCPIGSYELYRIARRIREILGVEQCV